MKSVWGFFVVSLLALIPMSSARAHGIPVFVDAAAGQLTTDKRLYLTEVESFGPVILGDLPGYTVELGTTIPSGTPIQLANAGALLYWSPAVREVVATESVLSMVNLAGDELNVANCTPPQRPGVGLGAYNGTPEWHQHVEYLVSPASSAGGAYAVPLTMVADGYQDSAPFLMVFGYYTGGFTTGMLSEAVADLQAAAASHSGDFNGNCQLDAGDIDMLSDAVRRSEYATAFDLSADRVLDQQDRLVWVEDLATTYFGDANLDGEFNSGDLVFVFQAGEYEDGRSANSGWATGDWDGDREFASSDFVAAFQAGGYEQGPRGAAAAVPEPAAAGWIAWGIGCWIMAARNHPRRPARRFTT